MFQPGSGTALILGSIANVVSLLYLPDRQLFSGSLPVIRRVLTYPPSSALRLIDTDLLTSVYPPSIPVLDCLFAQAFTPTGLHRPSLRSLSCRR